MSRTVVSRWPDPAPLANFTEPRTDMLVEHRVSSETPADGVHRFEQQTGPFSTYTRTVTVGDDGLTQTTTFDLKVGPWKVLFLWPVIRRMRRPPGQTPWWAPPQPVDATGALVLSVLAVVAVVGGYLGTIISQTIAFAGDEFETSGTAEGDLLAATRLGAFLSLALVTMADRRGRRQAIVIAGFVGVTATALGAVVPSLFWLGASQTLARGMATALLVLLPIVAAEEMPAGSRAYALSLLALAGGWGAGMAAVGALPLADTSVRGWRLIYALATLFLPVMFWVARRLPETRRFATAVEEPDLGTPPPLNRGRMALLASSKFFSSLFFSPASQFQNEFLKNERGFSASRISLFTALTQTPGTAGVVLGGRLADTRGRRQLGAASVAVGTVFAVLAFQASGLALWVASILAAIIGSIAVPALGVYSPEMFPTRNRGRANSIITVASQAGSVTGLMITGRLLDRWGSVGRPLLLLAIGPAIYALLIWRKYPETTRTELEDLNPEDRPFR